MVFSLEIRDGSLKGQELTDWHETAGKLAQIVRAANFLAGGGDIEGCTVDKDNNCNQASIQIDLGSRVPYWAIGNTGGSGLTIKFEQFGIPDEAVSFNTLGHTGGTIELDFSRFDVDQAYEKAIVIMKKRAKERLPADVRKVLDAVSSAVICGADGKPVDPDSAREMIAGIEQGLAEFKKKHNLFGFSDLARPIARRGDGTIERA